MECFLCCSPAAHDACAAHKTKVWQLALIFGLIPLGVLHQHERHWPTCLLNDACWGNVCSAEAFYIEKGSRVVQRGSDRHVLSDQASNFALSLLAAAWTLVSLLQEVVSTARKLLRQSSQDSRMMQNTTVTSDRRMHARRSDVVHMNAD